MRSVNIIEADLTIQSHRNAVMKLIAAYAEDPMGNGKPLSDEARRRLIPGLAEHPTTIIFLAFHEDTPIGIAVCFKGFSTFAAKPLINIHDFSVSPAWRGSGVGRRLLTAVEQKALNLECCKITLETQENNHRARHVYAAAGFAQAQYVEEAGGSIFLAKIL